VTYLGDQPWPFPTSLMVGFTARVAGAAPATFHLQESEIADARWFTRDELRAAVADGSVTASGRLSISRRLVEHWLGHPLDGA
jgi:NAD+ diphosphatase